MKSHYNKLGFEMGIHFLIMYAVMYTMVASFSDIFINLNNLYMTAMMVLPMAALMIFSMRSMFQNKKLNAVLSTGSLVLFIAFYVFMREQTFVGDKQFIKSMIPHHSGAILMCEESAIKDSELKSLCTQITESQRREIDQMKSILTRLENDKKPQSSKLQGFLNSFLAKF